MAQHVIMYTLGKMIILHYEIDMLYRNLENDCLINISKFEFIFFFILQFLTHYLYIPSSF